MDTNESIPARHRVLPRQKRVGCLSLVFGLFAWLIIGQLRASLTARDRYFSAFWTACGLSLIGKLFFEMLTGDVLFVQTQGFEPMLESHLAGAAVGVTAGLVSLASLRQE